MEQEVANTGATPQGNWIPPREKVVVNDQVLVSATDITDGEVSAYLLQMTQSITTEVQANTAQANWEVV